MNEIPEAGFTGVVWEARPTEQLARDLSTGPGAAPLVEAGAAWGRLAASFGAAVLEYDRIVAKIGESWRSTEGAAVVGQIIRLRDWLAEAATEAGRTAVHAEGQAAAFEVARLAMPHAPEIAALNAAKQAVEQAGTALGAPLIAAAAEIDTQQELAKASAARVMQSYESATTPLATVWEQQAPPVIAHGAALEAEQAIGRASNAPRPAATMPVGYLPTFGAIGPRAMTSYSARSTVMALAPEVVPAQQSSAVVAESATASHPVTGAAPASAAAGGDAERAFRAGAAAGTRPASGAEIDAGVKAAPAVLGAADTAHRAVPPPPDTAPGESRGPGVRP